MCSAARARCLAAGSLCLVVFVGLTGCSGKTNLYGKVTYQGKPVTSGSVILVGPDGVAGVGNIEEDGKYAVNGITAGTIKVGVSSPSPSQSKPSRAAARQPNPGGRGPAPAPNPRPDPKWFPIPDKFSDPEKSGVVITVGAGSVEHPIELK